MSSRVLHKSLNRQLTICGVERKLFFFAATLGVASFNLFSSLFVGILIFVVLYAFARWATATDPQILRILMNASSLCVEYDAGKREPYQIERITRHGAI